MTHVKSCGRKNGLHEAGIIARLTTEIGHLPATIGSDAAKEPQNKKSRGKKTTVEGAPKAYLEDVVNELGPKKKGPRHRIGHRSKSSGRTFENLWEGQDTFRNGRHNLHAPCSELLGFQPTQECRPSKLGSSGGPDTFASVLGMGMLEDHTAPAPSGSKPGVVHAQRVPGHAVLYSSMHAFRSSNLGGAFAKRSIFERDKSGNDTIIGGHTAPIMTFGRTDWEKDSNK